MMKPYLLLCCLIACRLSGQTSGAFEAEIRAFERSDSLFRPASGQIVLYGSSTLRLWSGFADDLAPYPVLNRGFGGSQMSDAVLYFDRVLTPLAPSWMLLYMGDNDLNAGKSPAQVFSDFRNLMQLVERRLPGARVAVYAVKPSPSRQHLMPQQKALNALFQQYCLEHPQRAYFIDIYPLLLKKGQPNPSLFLDDQLHLNAAGYRKWSRATRTFLKQHIKP